jgi:prepilin-type processing-associated H-X9-DG protein
MHPFTRFRTRAFAQIDLLGTCGCIGVLLLLVGVPSLVSLAGESRYVKCLDRMRAIGQASLVYSATDVAESAIPVHEQQFKRNSNTPLFVGAYEWGGKSGVGSPNSNLGYAPPYNSRYGTLAGFGPADRPLNAILYPHGFRENLFGPSNLNRQGAFIDTQLELDAYRCPSDDGPPQAAHCQNWVNSGGQTSFDFFGNSYAANMFMTAGFDGRMSSISPYLRSLSDVPNPQRTFNYEENIGRWAWATRRQNPSCEWVPAVDPGPKGTVRGWHGKDWTYNYAFVDGHVDSKQIYIPGTEDINGDAMHWVNEELSSYPVFPECQNCIPGSDNCPGYEGSFEAYHCVIIRGDGWQKDTLPAPPVCTGLYYSGSGRPSFESCVSGD